MIKKSPTGTTFEATPLNFLESARQPKLKHLLSHSPLAYRLLVVMMAFVLPAMPLHAEDLMQAYTLAKASDPSVRASRLEYQAVAFGIDEARGGFLPQISAGYSKTRTSQDILQSQNAVFATGSSTYPQTDLGLSLTQPIFRLAAWRRFDQAKASERMAAATLAAAEQDLIIRTATAYVGVLAAQNTLTFAQTERDSIQNQLTLAKLKYESGQATIVNLRDAEARSALNESGLVTGQNDLDDKIQGLRQITGKVISDLTPLSDRFALVSPDPLDLSQWVSGAQDQNFGIRMRIEAVEVARTEISKQKAAYAPTLDLMLTNDKNDTGGSLFGGGSKVRTNNIMLRLNIPIYDGGVTSAVTHAAAKRHEASEEELDLERRLVERQTRAAYQGIVGGIQRIAALNKSVNSLEAARRLKEEGYRAGLFTVLGVLDAERDLYAVKRDAAQARYDYVLNRLKLKQAAGTLDEQDLMLVTLPAQ